MRERAKISPKVFTCSFQVHSYNVRFWFILSKDISNNTMLWTGYQGSTERKYLILSYWCLCLPSNWKHWRNHMLSGLVYAAISSYYKLVPARDCTLPLVNTSKNSLCTPLYPGHLWGAPGFYSCLLSTWGGASRFARRHFQSHTGTSTKLASSE
jgi:hypothetical protein